MMAQKFKLDCVKSTNTYILLIGVINFKFRLINFVYIFFETPLVVYYSVTLSVYE